MAPPAPPEESDDLDEALGLKPRSRSSDRRRGRGERRAGAAPQEPVRRWRRTGDEDQAWDDDVDDGRPRPRREKPPIFWRARDSLYFEPLVALAILAILLVSLFAYTANWPPVYVVESNSMQHGSGDHIGVLNAGDIVLAEKVSFGSIVTYVDAIHGGFTTYGTLGDVLLYYPNGSSSATPIIHRAILYLQWDPHGGTYDASSLSGLACGVGAPYHYYARGTVSGCNTTGLGPGVNLSLYGIYGRTVSINFAAESLALGDHSGFLTWGDNNSYPDQIPPPGDPFVLSTLVEPGWVIGVARGIIPWFGAVKLLLDGNSGKVPTASWEFLGLTVAGVIFAAAGIHVLLRREHEPRPRRKDQDEEEPEERGEPPPSPSRPRAAVRPWKTDDAAAEEEAAPARPRRLSYEQRRRAHFVTSREKRPSHGRRKEPKDSDETDSSDAAS